MRHAYVYPARWRIQLNSVASNILNWNCTHMNNLIEINFHRWRNEMVFWHNGKLTKQKRIGKKQITEMNKNRFKEQMNISTVFDLHAINSKQQHLRPRTLNALRFWIEIVTLLAQCFWHFHNNSHAKWTATINWMKRTKRTGLNWK